MPWFKKTDEKKIKAGTQKKDVPDGLWLKCESCGDILYKEELAKQFWICKKCRYHFRISANDYRKLFLDDDRFDPVGDNVHTADPLEFEDLKTYKSRIEKSLSQSGVDEAVICGIGNLGGREVAAGFMGFSFIGGSMGSVVGERLALLFSEALSKKIPAVVVSCSGGARMQEGIFSLMQLAKTSALVAELGRAGIPFISILTNPTTAGVMASFASLGDIIIAEPAAHLGFAGPRVIKQTIGEELPEGFQTSEFFLSHGMIDMIRERSDMAVTVASLFDSLYPKPV